jgi:dienelactone hydrolase
MVRRECRVQWWAGLLAVVLTTAGCVTGRHAALQVQVDGAGALFDQPLRITISGARPDTRLSVKAATTDGQNRTWTASVDVLADHRGTVDLRTAPPVSGSYTGAHDTGLLWSMSGGPNGFALGSDTMTVTLTASQPGRTTATATVARRLRASGVTTTAVQVSDAGFVGTLFTPPGTGTRRPAVMTLGGSEGGIVTAALVAQALASHGYPALAVAYFGAPGSTAAGLPTSLTNIPLEYFAGALRWLAHRPGVDPKTIDVYGVSRGGELALLLGADFPDLVYGVIAASPSSVVNAGLPDTGAPAWTLHGRPVPHVPPAAYGVPDPLETDAVIPVEKITGPVALLCGDDDRLWPSCPSVQAIAARLGDHPHLDLPEPAAGHLVGFPVPNLPMQSGQIPSRYGTLDVGGTVQTDALGRLDAWPKLLTFLADQRG